MEESSRYKKKKKKVMKETLHVRNQEGRKDPTIQLLKHLLIEADRREE